MLRFINGVNVVSIFTLHFYDDVNVVSVLATTLFPYLYFSYEACTPYCRNI